jgi:hypothetical protein
MQYAVSLFLIICLWFGNAVADPATEEGIGPPTRSGNLPGGYFLQIGNVHGNLAVDINVVRQLSGGGTSGETPDGQTNIYCQGDLVDCDIFGETLDYGLPLYSAVEGEVASCWRNHPNAPVPGKPHPLRCCGGLVDADGECRLLRSNGKSIACDSSRCGAAIASCTDPDCQNATNKCPITRSGNYLVILTNDAHKVLYAHLAPGTIPTRLCPFDSEFMVDANTKPCNGCEVPAEALIPPADRASVSRGDFLGRIGRTGAAGGPHVHVGVSPVTENADGTFTNKDPLDYRLRNVWVRPADDQEGWQKLVGDIAPKKPMLIHPTPFLRRASVEVEPITDVTTADSAVTLSRFPDGRVELISWDVAVNGALSIQDREATTGTPSEMAMARPGKARNVITAMRAGNGELRMDFWSISQNGTITRGDADTSAGEVGKIDLAEMPEGRGVVSAVKTKSGNLKLIAWTLNDQNEIERLGSADGVAVRLAALTPIRFGRERAEPAAGSFSGMVTAAKLADGGLQVATWSLNPNNGSLGPVAAERFGEIDGQVAIAAVKTDPDREMVVVAGRHDGMTRLMSFTVSSDGTLTRKSERRLGDASDIDVSPVMPGRFTVAFRTAESGELRVIGVALEPQGKLILLGDEWAGPVGAASSSVLRRQDGETHLVFSAVRNGAGVLQVITYDANLE